GPERMEWTKFDASGLRPDGFSGHVYWIWCTPSAQEVMGSITIDTKILVLVSANVLESILTKP
ncbi:hypothetical protein DPMN_089570, partial [Dreissena polymorpha]